MLTDIFARRYKDTVLWRQFTQTESRLLVQAFGLVEEVIPFRARDGNILHRAEAQWTRLHDALSRELGVHELSQRVNWGAHIPMDRVCRAFVTEMPRTADADQLVKERLSFVELAFRAKEQEWADLTATLPKRIAETATREAVRVRELRKLGPTERQVDVALINARLSAEVEEANADFRQHVDELNERFRQAGAPLHYHNGYIQLAADRLTEHEIETPFWSVVSAPKWKNVDMDLKEALDRRDTNGRDPALYAAKALESTIKIISDDKRWTTRNEKGAHNYIDNLGARKNGQFIEPWEAEALKDFFTRVRNPLGHGPGNEEMPELTPPQTNWAIETCMSWIKTLILRT